MKEKGTKNPIKNLLKSILFSAIFSLVETFPISLTKGVCAPTTFSCDTKRCIPLVLYIFLARTEETGFSLFIEYTKCKFPCTQGLHKKTGIICDLSAHAQRNILCPVCSVTVNVLLYWFSFGQLNEVNDQENLSGRIPTTCLLN